MKASMQVTQFIPSAQTCRRLPPEMLTLEVSIRLLQKNSSRKLQLSYLLKN